jgi:DNA transformation protein and related proteins
VAVSNDFLAYVIEQLSSLRSIKSRRMFGGIGLYSDDSFFALIADDTLYFKVDDSNRAEYEQRGSKPFCPFPDKSEFSMSYYDVPAELLEDAEELGRWARKSTAIALATANNKATKRAKTKARPVKKAASRIKQKPVTTVRKPK